MPRHLIGASAPDVGVHVSSTSCLFLLLPMSLPSPFWWTRELGANIIITNNRRYICTFKNSRQNFFHKTSSIIAVNLKIYSDVKNIVCLTYDLFDRLLLIFRSSIISGKSKSSIANCFYFNPQRELGLYYLVLYYL